MDLTNRGRAPSVSDEDCQRSAEALRNNNGNQAAAAREIDIPRTTFQDWIKSAAKKGLLGFQPVMPGYIVSTVSTQIGADGEKEREWITQRPEPIDALAVPDGHSVKGVSSLVRDGQVQQQWIKTKADEPDPIRTAERIVEIFDGMKFKAPKVDEPKKADADCLSLFNIPDAHMGLYVWADEAAENWDLKKACRVYRKAFSDLVAMTPNNGTAIILAGGDQMHADSQQNQTARSGNQLDVDGRFDRVLLETCELFLDFVLCALQTHEKVIVRVLKGNHDPHPTAAVAYFLLASFRNEPRVTVDVSPSLFWIYQFGKVMLAGTHGHETKPPQMPGVMAARWPKIWGDTQFRYAHTFHVHHRAKYIHEDGGAIVETHHSPAPQDAWHYGRGFLSGRSLRSIIYHKEFGEFGGSVRPIIPE